ncbi:MAG TPA: tRNA guanosine(34) transglycosylase Tgt [Bacteroidota bacterium]|nr:tRNA guanosine(34) transglycosylase Tgt [Bacteroidota bacterium]
MKFTLHGTDGSARTGEVVTEHGTFRTPAFMPVGTQGSVKAVPQSVLEEIGVEIMLSNTYHLYLRPGTGILTEAGGLHRFIGWNHPILTDSGGYQVFSLSDLRTIEEEGVEFKSHLDGSRHKFTPELVVDIQRVIGSDIMMVLDECTPFPCEKEYAAESNELTLRWAERCRKQFRNSPPVYGHLQALFGIVQGSVYEDIRRRSASALSEMDFEGYAIGGLAVGEPADLMYEMVSVCTGILPKEKPRYLMGVGTPENLLESIERGVDMFDCVLPTRNGRNAMLFTAQGTLNITNAKFKSDHSPVDAHCSCPTCRRYSRAYIRHLFQVNEILALELASVHNVFYYQQLMRGAQEAIRINRFSAWKREILNSLCQEKGQYLPLHSQEV